MVRVFARLAVPRSAMGAPHLAAIASRESAGLRTRYSARQPSAHVVTVAVGGKVTPYVSGGEDGSAGVQCKMMHCRHVTYAFGRSGR
jgi:hypothetical protein